MSLIDIAQAACAAAPIAAPSAIVGNTDEQAQLILALANLAGNSLYRRPPGGWVTMIREYEFRTDATAALNATLDDSGPGGVAFLSDLDVTEIGSVAPNSWIASGSGITRNSIVTAVDTVAGTVTLNQPPASIGSTEVTFSQSDYALPADFQRPVDNTFWDRTNFWRMRGPLSPQAWQLYKSSVLGSTPSIWRRFRFRGANWKSGGTGAAGTQVLSIDPLPLAAGADLVYEYVSNGWCQSVAGTLQNSWKNDTDTGVLDEYLLQLGLQWRLFQRLGIQYAEQLAEYENEVDKAVAQDGGAPVLRITPVPVNLMCPNVPDGDWSGVGPGAGFTIGVDAIGGGVGIG